MSETEVVDVVRSFCERKGMKTDKGLALTVQKSKTALFGSVIVDFETNEIHEFYPVPDSLSTYKEKMMPGFSVCYNDTISPSSLNIEAVDHSKYPSTFPCCSRMQPKNPRRFERDSTFTDLLGRRGHHPNVIFEVKAQVDNGPMLHTKYFSLKHGQLNEVDFTPSRKLHSFRNYKCLVHNMYFAVDLYSSESSGSGYNYHHMRLNPFTRNTDNLLKWLPEL
ncbi:hypothetical protein P9112_001805 [Eukaryota sp. TZLM1-RC]